MASLPPKECCAKGFKHEGSTSGKIVSIDNVDIYVVGPQDSKKAVAFLPDLHGIHFSNNQLLADQFAAQGYLVFLIDVCDKDPYSGAHEYGAIMKWLSQANHSTSAVFELVDRAVAGIKQQYKLEYLATAGYCFGASPALWLANNGKVNVTAVAHPSRVTEDLVRGLKTPLFIGAAETDPVFTDELRQKTFEILREIKAEYLVQVYGGTMHGFAVRGDPKDPVVEAAKAKCFEEIVWFFNKYTSTN